MKKRMNHSKFNSLAALLLTITAGLLSACHIPHSLPDPVVITLAETRIPETDTPTPEPTAAASPVPSETPTPTATFGPTPTPTLGPDFFHGSLWYEPGFVSQEGLRYNGRSIKTGCTAASVQMVLDFWHDYKEDYPTMSAQTLLDRNVRQGQFNVNSGLNIMNTEDDLTEMHYLLGVRQDSNKEELLTALERYGPLLILTKVGWTPYGANHMAVISGYDPEADIIRILDPWTIGGIMEFPYENFDGIWSLNFGDETEILRRTFFFIVPYTELREENELFVPNTALWVVRTILAESANVNSTEINGTE